MLSELLRLRHERAAAAWLFLFHVALSQGSQTLWCEDTQGGLQGGSCQEELMIPQTAKTHWPALCPRPLGSRTLASQASDDYSCSQYQLESKAVLNLIFPSKPAPNLWPTEIARDDASCYSSH